MKLVRLMLLCIVLATSWMSLCAVSPVPQHRWSINNPSFDWHLSIEQYGPKPPDPWKEIAEEIKKVGGKHGLSAEQIQIGVERMYYRWDDFDALLVNHNQYVHIDKLFAFIYGKGFSKFLAGEKTSPLDPRILGMVAYVTNCPEVECLRMYELTVTTLKLNQDAPASDVAKALYWQHRALFGHDMDLGSSMPSPQPNEPKPGSGTPPASGSGTPPTSGSGTPPTSGSGTPPTSGSGTPPTSEFAQKTSQNSLGIYTVKSKDTLWDLAGIFYGKGNEHLWQNIAIRNSITDPKSIRAGDILVIPSLNSVALVIESFVEPPSPTDLSDLPSIPEPPSLPEAPPSDPLLREPQTLNNSVLFDQPLTANLNEPIVVPHQLPLGGDPAITSGYFSPRKLDHGQYPLLQPYGTLVPNMTPVPRLPFLRLPGL